MSKIKSPFDDDQSRLYPTEKEKRENREFEAAHPEQTKQKKTKKPAFKIPKDLDEAVRRVAAIMDELDRRGADPLMKELDALKNEIKGRMIAEKRECVFDEISEWESVLVDRARDVWDAKAFEAMLKPTQRKRYIIKSVNTDDVKTGIKSGDLSRAKMEKHGAVRKEPMGPALYVRKRKPEEEDEDV